MAITAISLPAGSYSLDAVTRLTKGAGTADWACSLNGDPAAPAATDDVDSGNYGHTQNNSVTANMHLTATLSSAGTIVLRCRTTGGRDGPRDEDHRHAARRRQPRRRHGWSFGLLKPISRA